MMPESPILRPMIDTTCPGCGLQVRVFEDDPTHLPLHYRGDAWAPGVLCNRLPMGGEARRSAVETTAGSGQRPDHTGVIRGADEAREGIAKEIESAMQYEGARAKRVMSMCAYIARTWKP